MRKIVKQVSGRRSHPGGIDQNIGNTKRKALPGNFYITQKTEMPAVIVEVGFISNPEECKLLMDPDYQAKVAYAIYAGIAKAQSQESELAMGTHNW